MAAAGGAGKPGRGAAATAAAAMPDEVIDITDSDRRRLALYPLYRVDIIKDSIDFGGITSPVARQKVRFIVNTIFKLQEMRYNLTHYGLSNAILERYADLLTENLVVQPWRERQYDIVDTELKNFKQTPILYPTCHLGYFQDREPSARIVVPALYNNKPLKGFEEYNVDFGIHDSGKPPSFFDSDIRQVQTPGSFIDPAARSRTDHVHMVNLDENDFRTMGLAHLLDRLTVTEHHRGDVKYTVSLSLNGSPKFTFEFTDNVNRPVVHRASNNNDLLAGNRVKNAYINDDGSIYEQIINYILVKLLGDLLLVYFGRKLINNRIYNKNAICVFTSDKNVSRLAQIFQIACMIQDLEHKLQGSERTFYTYYAYKAGRDPTRDPITSHMRINKLECKKVIKHNTGIIQTCTDCLAANAIYVGVRRFSPISDHVKAYMENVCAIIDEVNRTIESIHRTTDTDVYGDMLSLQMDPLEFKEIINRYRATDAVRFTDVGGGVRAYSALTTRFIFSLLEADHNVNARINALKDGHISREFRQFVYGSPMRVRDMVPEGAGAGAGAGAAAGGEPLSPGILVSAVNWLKDVTSIDKIITGIQSGFTRLFRGGGGDGMDEENTRGDDIPFSKILDETPYDELNNIIEHAIHNAIDSMNDPKPDIFIEDVLALIYPYFALRGQFSINPAFYAWFINYIAPDTFTGYIDTDRADAEYERIHSTPVVAVAAGGAGAAAPIASDPGYDININGQVFLQPKAGAGTGAGAGVAAPAAAVDDLYDSVPAILEAWQGADIVRHIKSGVPDRSEGYDMDNTTEMETTRRDMMRWNKNVMRTKRRLLMGKNAIKRAMIRIQGETAQQFTPKKSKKPRKHTATPSAGAPGGGGGGGGGSPVNVEHAGGARIRRTRKKRVNTLKRKLRKFRDTGRI